MLKLKKYLRSNGINAKFFAEEKIGFSPSYIYKILTLGMLPNLTAARRISEATDGYVSCYDWDIEPKENKQKNSKKKTKKKTEAKNTEIPIISKS